MVRREGGGGIFIPVKSCRNPIIIQQRPQRGETKTAPPTDAEPAETDSQLRDVKTDLKVFRSEKHGG